MFGNFECDIKIINQLFFPFISASTSGSSNQLNLTEQIEPPNLKKKIFSNANEIFIRFYFVNSEWSRYRGFLMTIQPIGKTNSIRACNSLISWFSFNLKFSESHSIDEKRANISMPSNLKTKSITHEENLKILIEVIKSNQNNETWKLFRLLLANSTNKFINSTNIKVEKCTYVYWMSLNFWPVNKIFRFVSVRKMSHLSTHCRVKVLGQMLKIVLKSIYPLN